MRFRRQLPVYSPLPARALLSGVAALVGDSRVREARLKEWIEREFGARAALFTDSGTSALALALRAAARATGRSVVALPAYGCYDLATAMLAAGVNVRWYDVDPETLGPAWSSLESSLARDRDVAAIVAVHLYGIPVDLVRMRGMAERNGSLLIEDAAQGIGGELDGRALGGWGDLGVLSFGRGKGITSGGGGALLANTPAGNDAIGRAGAIEPASRGVRQLVATIGQWFLARPAMYGIPASLPFLKLGETVFHPPHAPGAMSQAALGILSQTLPRVLAEAAIRRRNAARLGAGLGAFLKSPRVERGSPGWLRLPVLVSYSHRSRVDTPRARALGVMPGYPKVLTELPGVPVGSQQLPGAEELARSLFTLPVHSRLSERDLMALESWIDDVE